MSEPTYRPDLDEINGFALPSELDAVVEILAAKIHDTWAAGRFSTGWTWGTVRDDDAKTHPCLVPYAELSESERDYDRRSARQTIATLLSLGYEVRRR